MSRKKRSPFLTPQVIAPAVVGVTLGAMGVVYLATRQDLRVSVDWPRFEQVLGMPNDGGTMACDAPMDGVDAVDADDAGLWYGESCPEGSPLLTGTIRGQASPGATIKVYLNNKATHIGDTTAGDDGTWSVPGTVIDEGDYRLLIVAERDGSVQEFSIPVGIDTTSPTWADAWDVPDGIDAVGGIYLHGCGCPDWCWPAETAWTTLESCSPSPGYRCGPAGDCHADYTPEQSSQCMASRRAGCLTVSTAQQEDEHPYGYVIHTSTYYESGCWRVQLPHGYFSESLYTNSTTTRFYVSGYTNAVQWVAGDTVLLEDCQATCALTADEERAVSVRGSNYLDVTPAASADLDNCCIHNLSRVAILDDPTGYPPWDLTVGMTLTANESTRDATVAGITGTGPWSVTFSAPFFDHAPQHMVYNAAAPTDAQSAAWWDQTALPDWAVNHQCWAPHSAIGADGGPPPCIPLSEFGGQPPSTP
jgi:hypothetical protein